MRKNAERMQGMNRVKVEVHGGDRAGMRVVANGRCSLRESAMSKTPITDGIELV